MQRHEIRAAGQIPDLPIVINGAIGPRGDGLPRRRPWHDEAEASQGPQVLGIAQHGADLITALTMTHVGEAVGIARVVASGTVSDGGQEVAFAGGTTVSSSRAEYV